MSTVTIAVVPLESRRVPAAPITACELSGASFRLRAETEAGFLGDERMTLFERWLCALRGHYPILQIQGQRMFLLCSSCGHETQGWTIEKPTRHAANLQEPEKPRIIDRGRLAIS